MALPGPPFGHGIPVGLSSLRTPLCKANVRIRSAGAQRLHQLQIAPYHRRVQGGIACAEVIRVCATLQEKPRDFTLITEAGNDQCRLARRSGLVDIYACVEQEPCVFNAAVPRPPQTAAA